MKIVFRSTTSLAMIGLSVLALWGKTPFVGHWGTNCSTKCQVQCGHLLFSKQEGKEYAVDTRLSVHILIYTHELEFGHTYYVYYFVWSIRKIQ